MSDSSPRPWLVLLVVGLGLGMVVVDMTILHVAIPSMCDALRASLGEVEWALIGYSLALTGMVPVAGRLGDIAGRRGLFLGGVAIFSVGSLLCAAAPTVLTLVAARVVQAVGGALISSSTLAILTDVFPPGRRGVAMGMQAIMVSGGAAAGPALGGVLVKRLGWRSVFWVNVPLGLLTIALGTRLLPDLAENRTGEPVDVPGAALLVGGLASFLLGVTRGHEWGWANPATLGAVGVGLAALAAFVAWERRVAHPLIDLGLFRNRAFRGGQAAGVLATLAISSLTFLLPFYWQGIRGFDPERAGLLMIALPLSFMATSPVAGWLSDRLGARTLCTAGALIAAGGMVLLSHVTPTTAIPGVLLCLAVFGGGIGLFMAPNNNAVMSSVRGARRGVAAGLLGTMRYMGQSLGVALGGTLMALGMGPGLPEGAAVLPSPAQLRALAANPTAHRAYLAAFTAGFSTLCKVAAGILVAAAAASWLLRGHDRAEAQA